MLNKQANQPETHMPSSTHDTISRLCQQVAALILACLLASPAMAVDWTGLGIFDGANAAIPWKTADGSVVKAQPRLYGDEAGVRMDAIMRPDQERVYRDAAIKLDLSAYTEFSLAIRLSNPQAVSRGSLYFKSGDGWYGGWFTTGSTQWQTVTLARSAFGTEGKPVGWARIDGIRLAFWKDQPQSTRIEVAAIRGRSSPISILRNSTAASTLPGEIAFINRSTDRLGQWFSRYGLHADIIDDESAASVGIPPGCRLLILPCNPVITDAVRKSLLAFTQRGGRLIVIYGITPELAPLLGLGGKRWMSAVPPDAFSSMHLDTSAVSGLPPAVRQDSWNANIPQPATARVIGTWRNAAGVDSGLPAMTIGANGAFIGHVLTNVDRENKMQMLLALSAALVPDLVPMLAGQLRLQAERLFDFENWRQTRVFIAQTAARHGQGKRIQPLLQRIDRLGEDTAGATAATSFADTVGAAAALRDLIRLAYFEAVMPPASRSPEFRGVWCHNAAGPAGQSWDEAVPRLKRAGFNTLFANHQWAGTAYYPSDVLPVSPLIPAQGDLLQQCLDACRREGVALHLWSVLWVLENAPEAFVTQMDKAGRLMKDSKGKTLKWLCPANPLNVELAANAAAEAVRRYAVDGFHLDYIRYPDSDACFCTNCAARFRRDTGRAATRWPQDVISGPDRDAFRAWRRDRITEALTRIRRAVKAARPAVQVSAAVWGNWPGVRDSIGQDWVAWCRDGLLDFVTPMNYVTTAAEARALFTTQRLAVPSGFPIYPGIAPTTHNLPPEETVRQVDTLREAGARGFVLFELDPDLLHSHLPALRAGATAR